MDEQINTIRNDFLSDLKGTATTGDIEALKVRYLGKKGPIQGLMKGLRDLSAEERPNAGKYINELKVELEKLLEARNDALLIEEESAQLANEQIDITLPGRQRFSGRKHIITKTLEEIVDILAEMGFSVQHGPHIESDYYNFEALNFAEDHPARDMQDTFYLSPKHLLRTHTSNIQARVMEAHKPPIRIIAPGKVYRNETITARSHVFFHQVEAFYVDKGVSFADLVATLDAFLTKLFHQDVKTRYRPSYFPFVEPGMDVEMSCLKCGGSGCTLCKHTGWLEIAGAGMVHPEVLKNGDIDPEVYTGYAWGFGIERIVMMKYGIGDIRLFTENDQRFLKQFSER